MELDSEIDKLYGVPLDEFIHDRDELAKRLRREGEREAAERIKKLRKPSAGAWALNQALRRRRKETEALLAAGERLRQAHESVLSGGDPAELREAMQEERGLASALADCAEAIASETGKSGPALRERVRSTLHAATVDDEARDELAKGRFVREREAVGLGPFGGGVVATPASGRATRDTGRDRGAVGDGGGRGRSADATKAGRSADAAKGGRSADALEAGRSADATKGVRSAARAKAPSAAERRKAAEREGRERVAEAEHVLGEARAALEEAEAAHSEAAAELQAAREAVGAAEDVEREARAVARERRRAVGKLERELERLRSKGR